MNEKIPHRAENHKQIPLLENKSIIYCTKFAHYTYKNQRHWAFSFDNFHDDVLQFIIGSITFGDSYGLTLGSTYDTHLRLFFAKITSSPLNEINKCTTDFCQDLSLLTGQLTNFRGMAWLTFAYKIPKSAFRGFELDLYVYTIRVVHSYEFCGYIWVLAHKVRQDFDRVWSEIALKEFWWLDIWQFIN